MHERELGVRQATITLPYFDYEVLILYLDDGVPYIPVIALYAMLGLRMLCGMWTVCYSTRETEASLHLLPGWLL